MDSLERRATEEKVHFQRKKGEANGKKKKKEEKKKKKKKKKKEEEEEDTHSLKNGS